VHFTAHGHLAHQEISYQPDHGYVAGRQKVRILALRSESIEVITDVFSCDAVFLMLQEPAGVRLAHRKDTGQVESSARQDTVKSPKSLPLCDNIQVTRGDQFWGCGLPLSVQPVAPLVGDAVRKIVQLLIPTEDHCFDFARGGVAYV
jgi:hypothetical protein